MAERVNAVNAKSNRNRADKLEACEQIRIARIDLKRKNYKNNETILMHKEWQCSRQDRAGATVLLLDRMWKDRGP